MQDPQLGWFGDRRRAATGDELLARMQSRQTMCLHALATDRNQTRRFNEFLDNEAVTRHEMLVRAGQLTASRAVGRHVLAVADTSELNFATHTGRKLGFGAVGNGRDIGVFVHPVVALDAEHGGILGLVGAEVINRAPGKVEDRKTRDADDKESRRWLAGAETAGDVLAAAAMITVIEDREGDIYDQFARRPDNVHLLVRAARNRSVGRQQKLFDAAASWPEIGRYLITVPARHGKAVKDQRAERTALVAVRVGEVTIGRPSDAGKTLPKKLTLRVVDVREVLPPEDPKQRVHWCLVTTHAVNTAEDAMRIVGWYRLRWTIEQVFRTMKTDGVNVQTSQLTSPSSLVKLATIALIAAVRVMQLVVGRDGSTGQKLTDVISDPIEVPALRVINASLEGRTQKLKNPHHPDSLAWYAWIAARLGGWSGYTSKGYKPPGPKIMARGLKRLDAMVKGFLLADHSAVSRLP
jgi:Transposase DDE domain